MLRRPRKAIASSEVVVPAILGAIGGLVALLLVLLLRGPRESVVIEVKPAHDPNLIHVRVDGAVFRPGIYEIPRGSTAGEAVAAAGGLSHEADSDAFDFSAVVEDGSQLIVPSRPDGAIDVAAGSGVVNINSAGVEALESLPGIGPVLAQRIIDYRAQHGPFQSVDDLAQVSGISDRMVDELRPMVTIDS